MAILEGAGNLIELNAPLRTWLGLDGVDVTNRPFWPILVERCAEWAPRINELRKGGAAIEETELRLSRPDQPEAWFRMQIARGAGSCFVRLSSMLPPGSELAVTGWNEAWRADAPARDVFIRMLRAEGQLERLTRHWPGVIFNQRPDFSFETVSGNIEELTGRAPADWCQQPSRFWQVIHEADAGELQHQITVATQTRQTATTQFRVRNAQTGKVSYVLEHRHPILSGSGLLLGFEVVWLDVTRKTLAEKLLTSAAWKETLAVLTMGLAHDFSNVMAGIHSLSESFLSQVDETHSFYEGLGLIRKSSLQASQLVHRIVNLHLGKPGERNYHDLNRVVDELLELIRKVIPRRIEIATQLWPDPLPIYVDCFEFRQVIINLALNAADAMPERGRLVLRTSRLEQLPAGLVLHAETPRLPAVCLMVEDSGCGIKPTHIGLIFDPFFTTKSGGKGSGLGLYNARLFAEKHLGGIAVESEEGHGATFHVCLPEADFSETAATDQPASTASRRCGLVIYGPACALCDEVAETFRTEGYHVATAQTLECVAGLVSADNYTYDAVLILTESTGVVLAPHVATWRRSNPGLKLILRPIGRNLDELEPGLLNAADLIVTPEMSPRALMEKLKATLKG
jgi:signal transduction histidine kinase